MRHWIAFLLFACSSLPAHAYLSILDNAEVMPQGQFKLTTSAQALTETGGLNIAAQVDGGINEDLGMRGVFGVGKTDLFFGGLVKFVPIPDTEGQPAVGFNAGLLYAKDGEIRDTTIRFEPIASKRLQVDSMFLTPYASLPMGIRMRSSRDLNVDENTVMTWQLVVGSQLQLERWKKLQFIGEIGVDLDNSISHVAGAAIFYFDRDGFSLE